jgi:CubicO group peptidase (beta-lactamase class C family)
LSLVFRRRGGTAFLAVGVVASAMFGATPSIPLQTAILANAGEAPPPLAARLRDAYPSVRALVVARGACVVFEYYRKGMTAGTRSPVYSVTKSVLSILVGIAIDKGYLRLDEKLSELVPEASEAHVDPLAREITARDLLTMTAGFAPKPADAKVGDPTSRMWRRLVDRAMRDAPGSRFAYDTYDQNLLSVMLSRAIKEDARRFARRNLFDPLRIENASWSVDSEGYLIGATSLFLTARDMAKIGVLYLEMGRWGDKQIVSSAFVSASTTKQSEGGPPGDAAYGYFWWIGRTKTGDDAFFAYGQNDQLVYVVPKRDLVVALAADSVPGGGVSLVNDVVLPAAADLPASAPCVTRLTQGRDR